MMSFVNQDDEHFLGGGDWNFTLDLSMDRNGGNPQLWQSSVVEFTQLCNILDLVDIWRIRNPNSRKFTWQKMRPSLIQSRIDRVYISDNLQYITERAEIIPGIRSDHSAVTVSLKGLEMTQTGPNYWKINNSLLDDLTFVNHMRHRIQEIFLECMELTSEQAKWDYTKFKIKQWAQKQSKVKARERRIAIQQLETKIQDLETKIPLGLATPVDLETAKNALNSHYEYITKGLIIQSRVQYYEEGEKNSSYFLNLIKRNKAKSSIRKLRTISGEITSKKAITNEIKNFYKKLYSYQKIPENTWIEDLDQTKKYFESDKEVLKAVITKDELLQTLKTFSRNKSPGNDGLTYEFYMTFWEDNSDQLLRSLNEGILVGDMSTSQKQSVINLSEKDGKDK